MHLGHVVKADGRWRLFAFADGGATGAAAGLANFCRFLAEAPDSPVLRYTPVGDDVDTVIDVRAVFQQGHRDLELAQMPAFLLPSKGRYGLTDYEKLYCRDAEPGQDIFDLRGIDRVAGCVVVVRPDQFVAQVLPLGATGELAEFFAAFMVPRA